MGLWFSAWIWTLNIIMYFDKKQDVRLTKEIEVMIEEILKEFPFYGSRSQIIRSAVVNFHQHLKTEGVKKCKKEKFVT